MVFRDFNIEITENMRRRFIDKEEPIQEEEEIIEEEKEELERILVIGPKQINKCHFSENLFDVIKRNGFDTRYICPEDLKNGDWNDYITKKRHYNISRILQNFENWKPNLIIIDECAFFWDNFTSIPVFYHHREFKRPPTVFYPTVAFFWHQAIIDNYRKLLAPDWMYSVSYHLPFYIAVDPTLHQPKKKKYKGVVGIGYREELTERTLYELSNVADLLMLWEEEQEFKKTGLRHFDSPVTDMAYRIILSECEALWIPVSIRQYTTRRMLEAMLCKTLCIIKLENKEHADVLEQMGYKNGEHYVGVDKISEIEQAFIETTNKEEIIENAYNITLEQHTYEKRFEQIVDLYYKLQEEKGRI